MLKRPTCAGKHHQCDPHTAWSGVLWQQLPGESQKARIIFQVLKNLLSLRKPADFSVIFLQNHAPLQRIFVGGAIPQVLGMIFDVTPPVPRGEWLKCNLGAMIQGLNSNVHKYSTVVFFHVHLP